MNKFYFDGEITLEMAKAFLTFVDNCSADGTKVVECIVSSPGGDTGAMELMKLYMKRLVARKDVEFYVIGECSSAMFDIMLVANGKAKFFIGFEAEAIIHCSEDTVPTPRAIDQAKLWAKARKDELKATVELYKDVLTSKQLRAVKRGLDVSIGRDQLKEIFDGRDI